MHNYIYRKSNGKPSTGDKLLKTLNLNGVIESVREIKRVLFGFSDTDNVKDYIDEGISTATADFKGTFTTQADMEAVTGNRNDYCYLISTDQTGNYRYNRHKWVVGTGWVYEFTIKQDDFTAAEWAAIQSGITSQLVAKLSALPTNVELTQALSGKLEASDLADVIDTITIDEQNGDITIQYDDGQEEQTE